VEKSGRLRGIPNGSWCTYSKIQIYAVVAYPLSRCAFPCIESKSYRCSTQVYQRILQSWNGCLENRSSPGSNSRTVGICSSPLLFIVRQNLSYHRFGSSTQSCRRLGHGKTVVETPRMLMLFQSLSESLA